MLDLNTIIFGNTLVDYGYTFAILIFWIVLFKGFQIYILSRLKKIAKKTTTDVDDTLIGIVQSLKPPFYYFLAFYLATYSIQVSEVFRSITEGILLVLIVYQVITAVQILINYVIGKRIDVTDNAKTDVALLNVGKIAKVILWVLGILLILSNFGIDITSLIAGLGVGGIAIAFALKSILADLFSSFAIYFDKPFKVGDFIKVGSDGGTVLKIGIMTTRLKTSLGEELVISNQELISSRVQNFKKMEERRGDFSFGVAYETSVGKLRGIPNDIKQIIESIDGIRFARAHFNRFDDSALNFDVVYYVESNGYDKYADSQQEINLKIMEKFEEKGIEMAYPTQTIFVKKEV